MGIPEGSFAIAAFVVIALPGFIYAAVRRWARGETSSDRDVGLTIARGAAFAVSLTCVYLVTFGAWLFNGVNATQNADALTISEPRLLGATVLILYVAVPAAVTAFLQRRHVAWSPSSWATNSSGEVKRGRGWAKYPHSRHGYSFVHVGGTVENAGTRAGSVTINGGELLDLPGSRVVEPHVRADGVHVYNF